MPPPLRYFLLFLTGSLAGLFYFGGLWLTLKQALNRPRGAVWIFISFILRTAVVVTLFVILMENDFYRILVLMAGFIWVRFLFTSRMKKPKTTLPGGRNSDILSRSDHPL